MSTSIPGARACSRCAYTNFGAQAACLHCGWPLAAIEVELPGAVVLAEDHAASACPSCGVAIGAFDRFCTSCGNPLG